MSDAKSQSETSLGPRLSMFIRHHATTIVDLPAGEFHRVTSRAVDGAEFAEISHAKFEKLQAADVLTKVEKRRSRGSPYHIWRVDETVRQRAEELVASRDSPCGCGHTGIRNLGDGWYSCTNDDCDVRVRRSEVSD